MMKQRKACPACQSASLKLLYTEPFTGSGVLAFLEEHYFGRASDSAAAEIYELKTCSDCGLAFQGFIPDDDLLDEVYNAWIPGTDMEKIRRNYSFDEYRYLAEQVQFVIQHLGLPPGEIQALDVGFGWAHWARMAMGYGIDVSGVELSNERRDYGKSVGIKLQELGALPRRTYHFIHTEQVFEHLGEPRAVLEELVEALAPGGLLKISVPDSAATLRTLAGGRKFGELSIDEQMPIIPLEHLNCFTHASLAAFGKLAGLKAIRPSFRKLYNSASGALEPKHMLRVVARPFYRHVYPRNTFVYFERAS